MNDDSSLGVGLLALAGLVLGIIALAKLSHLAASIEELKRRFGALERGDETPTPKSAATKSAVPPPLPADVAKPATPSSAAVPSVATKPHHAFNWESILGVKLFAWIGGFAFFLGIVFFVKYAFENNWITPAMRIVAGAIIGIALIVIALLPRLRRYRVPAQSLCATGVLILYADVYAAHAAYSLISLPVATALTWFVTGGALFLAHYLQSQSAAWLAVIGGFLTPFLFDTSFRNPIVLFSYIGALDCAIVAVGSLKRWNYLTLAAALGSVMMEFAWALECFGRADAETSRFVFLGMQALFLAISIALNRAKLGNNWSLVAAALTGFAVLFEFAVDPAVNRLAWDFGYLTLLLGAAGLIALAADQRASDENAKAMASIVGIALAFTWIAEWSWDTSVISGRGLPPSLSSGTSLLIGFYVALFLLFSATPYFCGIKRVWPWMIAAIAGPLQFRFVHEWITQPFGTGHQLIPNSLLWLVTIAFAIPSAFGVWYLVKKEEVQLASGDSRLAAQGAAVLTFVSLVFPVQLHREWITLGWAIEGLALILLYRWVPNRRLRIVALIVLAAAFVRLALNPAVFEYHKRSATPILNWYLYAYGIAAVCLFLSGHWFGEPKEKWYGRKGSALLYSLSGLVLFLLMNIEIADYFSIGPTLTFSFSGNFARDMTYTIAWALFAFCLVVFGIKKSVRAVRLIGIALLLIAFAKLFLHDLDSLEQLYRIGAFITVAIIAIVASFVYQRFLLPRAKT